jgi:hypothetical protein
MLCDRRVLLSGLLGLGACTETVIETVSLPEFRGSLTLDPVRQSIDQGADMLSHPQRMTGQPWEVARLVQALEFLAVELRVGARWNSTLPMASLQMPAARPEWRQAFGIAAEARAQDIIDSLAELRSAYANQRTAEAAAALRTPLFSPGGQETLARFGTLPALPRTTRAMLDARRELQAQGRERRLGSLLP